LWGGDKFKQVNILAKLTKQEAKMKEKIFFIVWTLSFVLVFTGLSLAQDDPGIPDTVRVECVLAVPANSPSSMKFYLFNDEYVAGFSVPLTFYNSSNLDIYVDSIILATRVTSEYPDLKTALWHNGSSGDTAKTLLTGAVWFTDSLPPGQGLLGTVYFHTGPSWNTSLFTKVDSTTYHPPATGTSLELVTPMAVSFKPQFVAGCLGAPPINHKPVLTAPASATVYAGQTVNFMVIATDLDPTDILTIAKYGVGSFTTTPNISPDTGFFTWATIDSDTLNSPYTDTFIVDDGIGLKDTSIVTINVRSHPPTLILPAASFTIFGGDTLSFQVKATDPKPTDILTIIKHGVGNFTHVPSVSPTTGYFSWATAKADTLHSPYTDTFIVDDGAGYADTGMIVFYVVSTPPEPIYGDMNRDGNINMIDVVFLLKYLFSNGPPPVPLAAGDLNADCYINLADVVLLSNYLIKSGPAPKPWCLPGDVKHDGYVNLVDVVYFINYIFLSGPAPVSLNSTDVNGDCTIDIVDLVYLVTYLFRGGPLPVPGCAGDCAGGLMLSAVLATHSADVVVNSSKIGEATDIIEIPISASFNLPLAAIQLEVGFDPATAEALPPLLSSRTKDLTLYHNTKLDYQLIGIVDLNLAHLIEPGEGTILTLRFKVKDSSFDAFQIRIRQTLLIDQSANELPVKIHREGKGEVWVK
jgi:hypothetical protein